MLELCLVLIDDEQDKALFEKFYDKYNGLVYYIGNEHLKNHYLAEEVVQEAFIYIAKNFDCFKGDNKNIRAYVAAVAKGTAISLYRKESRHFNILNYDDVKNECDVINVTDLDVYDEILLKQALEMLPENMRNMIELAYVYGLTSAQIGEIHKISAANVRKKIERAKKSIKKQMKLKGK